VAPSGLYASLCILNTHLVAYNSIFYLHCIKLHPNVQIHHQHLVNCVIYRIFGHKTWRDWYVNKHITSQRHTAVSIVQIPVWCLKMHRTLVRQRRYVTQRYDVTYVIRCQTALGASRSRRLIDGSGAKYSVRGRLYYVTLHWPA